MGVRIELVGVKVAKILLANVLQERQRKCYSRSQPLTCCCSFRESNTFVGEIVTLAPTLSIATYGPDQLSVIDSLERVNKRLIP